MSAADKQLMELNDKSTSLASPKDMVNFASTLKQFIIEQELYTNIKGKNYVHVEAWQFAGASMGVIAIVKATDRVATDDTKEIKYRAEVELRRVENDQKVGGGIAFCSNKEYSKKSFDEYAIASMAQTRATSKAYRVSFGWLMKVAGYEATPHEEMDGIDVKPEPEQPKSRNTVADNAKFMNTKPSDVAEAMTEPFEKLPVTTMPNGKPPIAAPTEEQLNEIADLAKKAGHSSSVIAQRLMTISTNEEAEEALAKLRGGKK